MCKIFSITYNRPDFIKVQKDSIDKFLKDEHELIIVNNARQPEVRELITEECVKNNLRCIKTTVNAPEHLPGLHHALSLNSVWNSDVIRNSGKAIIMDGDVFMVEPFSIEEYLYGYVMAGAKQKREKYHYLTPIVMLFDLDEMPDKETINWIGVHVNGVALDTGGGLYAYLESHPQIKENVRGMQFTHHITDYNNNLHVLPDSVQQYYKPEYVWELFTHSFLHYCRSSNWDNQSWQFHSEKTAATFKFVYDCINGIVAPKKYDFQSVNPIFGW